MIYDDYGCLVCWYKKVFMVLGLYGVLEFCVDLVDFYLCFVILVNSSLGFYLNWVVFFVWDLLRW